MTIKNLAQRTSTRGAVTAVWHDEEEDTFVVQHEFLQISFLKSEFNAFLDTLLEARENSLKGGRVSFET